MRFQTAIDTRTPCVDQTSPQISATPSCRSPVHLRVGHRDDLLLNMMTLSQPPGVDSGECRVQHGVCRQNTATIAESAERSMGFAVKTLPLRDSLSLTLCLASCRALPRGNVCHRLFCEAAGSPLAVYVRSAARCFCMRLVSGKAVPKPPFKVGYVCPAQLFFCRRTCVEEAPISLQLRVSMMLSLLS